MNPTLVLNSSHFLLYVKVIGGQGDGPIITIDGHGIRIIPDPRPLSGLELEKVQAAAKQITAGVTAFQAAVSQHTGAVATAQ